MVVSNSSPLLNLAVIERLELLRDFYETVHIPDVVWNELVKKARASRGAKLLLQQPGFIGTPSRISI